ncbi:putative membrane protein [Bacillus sp. V2I10]|nr:putative membrane protein [Bacillus sp. V2I10]
MKQENKLVLFIPLIKIKPILSGLVFLCAEFWGYSEQLAIIKVNTPFTKEEHE